ncbi:periostin-like [Gordionus sp. m RMFG-2023]|uniref:periostin-like n=1 Tax=Gordionus sp. m RMFG-2023 TaxID=3053472 RepID=UPI0031FCB7DB
MWMKSLLFTWVLLQAEFGIYEGRIEEVFPFPNYGLTKEFEEWKSGPNVCKDLIILKAVSEDGIYNMKDYLEVPNSRFPVAGSIVPRHYSKSCTKFQDFYQCNTKMFRGQLLQHNLTVYSCCYGFANQVNQPGCPKKMNLTSMVETLSQPNFKYALDFFDLGQLKSETNQRNITLFLPEEQYLKNFTKAQANSSEALLAHSISGYLPRSHMWNKMVMPNLSPLSSPIRLSFIHQHNLSKADWAVNCVPLEYEQEVLTTQGIIYKIKGNLSQPVNQLVYSYLLGEKELNMSKYLLSIDDIKNLSSDPTGFYTYIIPSNKAFDKLDPNLIKDLNDNKSCAMESIKLHVITDWVCPGILDAPTNFKTLEGSELIVGKDNTSNISSVNGSPVNSVKVFTNGVILFVDHVLVSNKSLKLSKQLANESNAIDFIKLLMNTVNSTFEDSLNDSAVLIPENKAFDELSLDIKNKLVANKTFAKLFLDNHIIPLDKMKVVRFDDYQNNDPKYMNVTRANYLPHNFYCLRKIGKNVGDFCGGKYYSIPKAFVPLGKSILETLKEHTEVSTFTDLLENSNLTLSDDKYYTLWVPVNEIMKLYLMPNNISKGDISNLTIDNLPVQEFIKRQIYPGRSNDYCCSSPENEFYLNHQLSYPYNADGLTIYAPTDRSKTAPLNVKIVKCDILGDNFLIHFVDKAFNDTIMKLEPPFPIMQPKVPLWVQMNLN